MSKFAVRFDMHRKTAHIFILAFTALTLSAAQLSAQDSYGDNSSQREPLFTAFRENYFTTGIPLNLKPDWDTNDIAFQVSMRLNLVQRPDFKLFLAYSQLTLWDAYKPSNPVRSTNFCPGIYFCHKNWIFALEHISNGHDGPTSRGLNHVMATYTNDCGDYFSYQFMGRIGISSVGNTDCLDLYTYYMGYASASAEFHSLDRRLRISARITPIWNKNIANYGAEIAWRPTHKLDWLYLTMRYHYGYDENQLDCCTEGVVLKHMLRFGISVQPSQISHKLFIFQ